MPWHLLRERRGAGGDVPPWEDAAAPELKAYGLDDWACAQIALVAGPLANVSGRAAADLVHGTSEGRVRKSRLAQGSATRGMTC